MHKFNYFHTYMSYVACVIYKLYPYCNDVINALHSKVVKKALKFSKELYLIRKICNFLKNTPVYSTHYPWTRIRCRAASCSAARDPFDHFKIWVSILRFELARISKWSNRPRAALHGFALQQSSSHYPYIISHWVTPMNIENYI
jgi:hypothetical protein